VITTGEFSGLAGFSHVYGTLGITFADNTEAQRILELAQVANAHTQQPLTDDELRFIAKYPEQATKIFTLTP
jgi:homocitrate synthase NifV